MRLTDSERRQVRIAALDAAVHMVTGGGRSLVNNDEFVTDAAAHFEEWLTRPTPVNISGPPTPERLELMRKNAEAESWPRPGGCTFAWRRVDDDHVHLCRNLMGHDTLHYCTTCSAVHTGQQS